MLPWWGWLGLWVVLVVGAAALLGAMGWRVWGKAKKLLAEIGRASELVSQLEARAEALSEVPRRSTAVTQDPFRLREEYRAQRLRSADLRASRRNARLPEWARVH